jgi:hypothetical protein
MTGRAQDDLGGPNLRHNESNNRWLEVKLDPFGMMQLDKFMERLI